MVSVLLPVVVDHEPTRVTALAFVGLAIYVGAWWADNTSLVDKTSDRVLEARRRS